MLSIVTMLAVLAAAPVQLDLGALKAGQLPAAGTLAEADTCAAETMHLLLADLKAGKSEAAAGRARAMLDWEGRAATPRQLSIKDYGKDAGFVAAVQALDAIDAPAHVALEAACADRLRAGN